VTVVSGSVSIENDKEVLLAEKRSNGESSEEGADPATARPIGFDGRLCDAKSLTRSCNGLSIDWFDPACPLSLVA